jgi:hypothetical protein
MSVVFNSNFGNYASGLLLAEYSWLFCGFRRTVDRLLLETMCGGLSSRSSSFTSLFDGAIAAFLGMFRLLGESDIQNTNIPENKD